MAKFDKDTMISIEHISKSFEIFHERPEKLKDLFLHPLKYFKSQKEKMTVLKHINLKIERGEFVGIIGRNGSGKSTLLKLLANIYAPDQGKIRILGKLVPFLELGVGFNPDLTVKENIFLNGTILGMTTAYLRAQFNEIISFAELEYFVDTPVKNLSSGMQVRLALAVAIQTQADIYLLDEILAVGDIGFREKSLKKMQEILMNGNTVVYVSHDMNQIRQFCTRAIFIKDGEVVIDGHPNKVIEQYEKSLRSAQKEPISEPASKVTAGSDGRAKILKFQILNSHGQETFQLHEHEEITCKVSAEILKTIENPVVMVQIRDKESEDLLTFNTPRQQQTIIRQLNEGDHLEVTFKGHLPLYPGNYLANVLISDPKAYTRGTDLLAAKAQGIASLEILRTQSGKVINDSTGYVASDFSHTYSIN